MGGTTNGELLRDEGLLAPVANSWFLSREGQMVMHQAYNERQSLRVDVPNDMIRETARLQPGVKYIDPRADSEFLVLREKAMEFVRAVTCGVEGETEIAGDVGGGAFGTFLTGLQTGFFNTRQFRI